MKLQLLFLALILSSNLKAQEWVATQAQITALETRFAGRKFVTTAQVKYAAVSGDSLSGKVSLIGLPFFGFSKEVGEVIPVVYQNDNPYLVETKEDAFLQMYGLYFLIGLGIVISGYRLIKKIKPR